MNLRFLVRGLARAVVLAGLPILVASTAQAQTYRNVVNARFNTVSDGPLQAIIVDVPAGADARTVDAAVAGRVNAVRKARVSGLQRQLDLLKRTFRWKGPLTPGIPDIVYLRQNGQLATQTLRPGRAEDLIFDVPLTASPGDGGWTQAQKDELGAIITIMYDALKNEYGAPLWSGHVTIIDGDNQASIISDPNALSGGVYDVSRQQITFAQYNSIQSKVLNLTQMMALAFHGPASISFDAWERGMARAATLEAVRAAQPRLNTAFGNGSVQVDDPLWSALDRYELLNQPALGNDRFFPVSKTNGEANTASFPNMLIPRLIMSGSAWLKVAAEYPLFFQEFNKDYLAAYKLDQTVKNSVPKLKVVAAQAIGGGTVEGLSFSDWYNRQYILDTSVSPGTKEYALVSALRPAPTDDDYSIGIVLYYYETTFDSSGNSDERNLNGTSYPIYWDYTSQNRLFLAAQYERVDIRDGLGTVAPTFFNTIGGDAALNGMMRVAIDLPINDDNLRLYVAPRSMGKEDNPNNFWGVVVGADTGTVTLTTDAGANATLDVKQGAFGGKALKADNTDPFTRPQTGTIVFKDANGNTVATKKVDLAYGGYVPVFYVSDPVTTVDHPFPAGPAMISFPLQPLKPKAADALLDPATGLPLFTDSNLLMARWQQNLNAADGDNYQRYPTMDPIAPGKGYWSNFPSAITARIQGRSTASDPQESQGLQHGWNQIGDPYDSPIALSTLQFQYLADNVPVDLPTAIGRGWIVVGGIPGFPDKAIWQYVPGSGYQPADHLEPWNGYWIRVLVSEGVTITYPNPSGRAVKIKSRAVTQASTLKGWAIPLTLRSNDGLGATAYLGQSADATTGFNAKYDAQRPPEFSRAVPIVAFEHTDWGANNGRYFSDVRNSNSRDAWELTLYTPKPHENYTLSWSNLSSVPRGTRLVLVDPATGARQYMQSSSGYTFNSGVAASRKVRIELEIRSAGVLRVMNVVTRMTRSVGAGTVEIGYDLNQSATVTTEIRGADGRLIRRIGASRAASTGTNTVVWDTKDERAVSVPSGSYMVQITARTPEGETARTFQMVTLVR